MKELILGFFSNLLAVILGIVITFAVQGMINRAQDRRDVRSALELVRSELATNLEDIGMLDEFLDETQASAQYLVAHEKDLAKCPEDSVLYHTGIVYSDVSVALSHDALELLKMSTLFPKIGDNNLSMNIIRAYDTCDLLVSNFTRYLSFRDAQGSDKDRRFVDQPTSKKSNIPSIIVKAKWFLDQPMPEEYMDVSDIQAAIDAIDTFLRK